MKFFRLFCFVSFSLLFVCGLSLSAADAPATAHSIPELQVQIEKILAEGKVPGASVAIVSREQVEWVAGLGKADVAAGKVATSKTLFRIGSTSKNFAALAALKLQEEGKLKLTDTVKQWAPDVAFENPWEATDPVRLVHLMEHTAGFNDMQLREYAHCDPTPVSLKDALAFGAPSRVCRWHPGSRMAYCNSGPAVLAYVIEKVTGERFEDYVRENFFLPMGMKTASYFLTPEVAQSSTKLYQRDGVTPFPYWHIIYRPAGAINASAEDMASYIRFLLNRGSVGGVQLLKMESMDRMERPTTLPAAQLGDFAGYGLYNYVSFENGFEFHGHGGGVSGGITEMAYCPQVGRGYAFMLNAANGGSFQKISHLLKSYHWSVAAKAREVS